MILGGGGLDLIRGRLYLPCFMVLNELCFLLFSMHHSHDQIVPYTLVNYSCLQFEFHVAIECLSIKLMSIKLNSFNVLLILPSVDYFMVHVHAPRIHVAQLSETSLILRL